MSNKKMIFWARKTLRDIKKDSTSMHYLTMPMLIQHFPEIALAQQLYAIEEGLA
jgi:hypothetical protein